jgi:hypothetical protein
MPWGVPFRFTKSKLENQLKTTNLMSRLVLRRGETYRLPVASAGIQVVSGLAWVTQGDLDIFLGGGQRLLLTHHKEAVLVSGLSQTPLILEILGNKVTPASGVILTPQPRQPGPI